MSGLRSGRWAALELVAALILALASGCGDDGDDDAGTASANSEMSEASETSAAAPSMNASPTRSRVESRKAPNGVPLPPARARAPSRMSMMAPTT